MIVSANAVNNAGKYKIVGLGSQIDSESFWEVWGGHWEWHSFSYKNVPRVQDVQESREPSQEEHGAVHLVNAHIPGDVNVAPYLHTKHWEELWQWRQFMWQETQRDC